MSLSRPLLTADSDLNPIAAVHDENATTPSRRCETPDQLESSASEQRITPDRSFQNSQRPSPARSQSNQNDEILPSLQNTGSFHIGSVDPSQHRGRPLRQATKKDNDAAWDKSYVTSFDGGGVRGLSTLYILKRLMQHIKRIEKSLDPHAKSSFHPLEPPTKANGNGIRAQRSHPSHTSSELGNGHSKDDESCTAGFYPCHYMDYMAGTSTGGLIAIMLGRLRMDVDDTIDEFINLAGKIFGKPRLCSIRGPIPYPRPKHDYRRLEAAVREVLNRRLPKLRQNIGGQQFRSNQEMCKTMVIAHAKRDFGNEDAYIFRSYDHTTSFNPDRWAIRNPGEAHAINIDIVARATTAAPTYFKAIEIENRKLGDGGFGCNNPSWEAYNEVKDMHNADNSGIALLVSIGTGENPVSRFTSEYGIPEALQFIRAAKSLVTDTHKVDETLRTVMTHNATYFRFNVDEKLSKIKLDTWKSGSATRLSTAKEIEEITNQYLDTDEVTRKLESVAKILVHNRRIRATTDRWGERMLGHKWRCCVENCPQGPNVRTRVELESHLQIEHDFGPVELQTDAVRKEYDELVERGKHIAN